MSTSSEQRAPVKIVGGRNQTAQSPADFRRRALALQRHLDRVHPWPRPRGWVYRARTWREYADWRQAQTNPRLW